MAVNAKNVRLGVCAISFGGTDLGATKGGVELTVETSTHEVLVDQTGETPINEYIMGRKVNVKVPLAETTLENLVKIMPGATLVGGALPTDPKRVDVATGVGISLLDGAQELILHPIGLPVTDKSQDIVLHKAATPGQINFAYKVDEERIFNVEFKAYPDPENDDHLLGFGDPAAV
ncbi:hypothetical protein [Castellaniella sp.]|uniref:hypothetical protein n=1 Tax=Castellaniella sp. TaxID=1955812 RepID=UPI002AFFD514|nr:hypothetical protein [Castellaniella sp.]